MSSVTGCEKCKSYWFVAGAKKNDALMPEIKVSVERQAVLHRCKVCGCYWEVPSGNYPSILSAEEAAQHYGAL